MAQPSRRAASESSRLALGGGSSRWWAAVLFLLSLGLLLPVLSKPFHIDDPVVLAVAERVLTDPLDPMGGRIDWFGERLPLWQVTTNPPLLSYYLAPFLDRFGYSEIALHLALFPFLLLLVFSLWWLARRFCPQPWAATLFVLSSPAVLVSINLMRDVPATSFIAAAAAMTVRGSDRSKGWMVLGGGALLGAAVLTKYSAGVMLPVLVLYAWRRREWKLFPLLLAGCLGPVLVWMLWTWAVYGAAHPLFLLTGRHSNRTFELVDNGLGALAIVGSALLLLPALILQGLRRRRLLWISVAVAALAAAAAAVRYGGVAQFTFWVAGGGMMLVLVFGLARREGKSPGAFLEDGSFLMIWVLAVLLFAVLVVPFQAVRHLLPALIPLCLLIFRQLDPRLPGAGRGLLWGLLVIQTGLTATVAYADYLYADCYRSAASRLQEQTRSPDRPVWFVGHWGWKLYAEQAGLRQLHGDGPSPVAGDLLVWPRRVHIGNVFSRHPELRKKLELVEEFECSSALPVRTMNFQGAAFYAVIRGNAPFAFQDSDLETFRVYRVK